MYPKEKKDTDKLYQSTREILDYMTTARAYPSPYVICSIQRDKKSEAQSALYSIVREGSEMTGAYVGLLLLLLMLLLLLLLFTDNTHSCYSNCASDETSGLGYRQTFRFLARLVMLPRVLIYCFTVPISKYSYYY